MSKRIFKWPPFRVTITFADYEPQPWGEGASVPCYRVTVTDGTTTYRTKTWASVMASQEGREDEHEQMGAMVLDELCSAYCDADEFWSTTIGDKRPSRERSREIEGIIDKAAEFGEPLIEAVNLLRERDLA